MVEPGKEMSTKSEFITYTIALARILSAQRFWTGSAMHNGKILTNASLDSSISCPFFTLSCSLQHTHLLKTTMSHRLNRLFSPLHDFLELPADSIV
jgi:hypothetical protein